jgi:hypothetical protein
MPPAFFALVIFQVGSCVFARAGLDHDPPTYVSCVTGMTGIHHHAQLFFLNEGLTNVLSGLSSNLNLLISAS